MDDLKNLGERLKELRQQRQLTMDMVVYDVSNTYHIEFTKGNLSRWENGINYPSLVYAAYLAKYYNVSLDYLIGNTDVKTPVELLTHKTEIKRQKEKIQAAREQYAEAKKRIKQSKKYANPIDEATIIFEDVRGKLDGNCKKNQKWSVENTRR